MVHAGGTSSEAVDKADSGANFMTFLMGCAFVLIQVRDLFNYLVTIKNTVIMLFSPPSAIKMASLILFNCFHYLFATFSIKV